MKITHHPAGVTLFEVLISMAVFAIMSAIVLNGFIDSRRVQDLRQASGQLVADLRQIQTMTFANQSFPLCSNTGVGTSFGSSCSSAVPCPGGTAESCGLVPAGGYGIEFTTCTTFPCTYQFYGDIANGQISGGVPGGYNGLLDVAGSGIEIPDPLVRTVTLPNKISLVSINVTGGATPAPTTLSINIVPPKPTTTFNPSGVSVSLCLEQQQSHLRRLVTMVAASGQVSERAVPNCP